MTRINLVDPSSLCDQHLLAEIRELTRIPNAILKGIAKKPKSISPNFVLGTGHVTFFYDKLDFLFDRYLALQAEAIKRGFNPSKNISTELNWATDIKVKSFINQKQWSPSHDEIELSKKRLLEKLPASPRYNSSAVNKAFFKYA